MSLVMLLSAGFSSCSFYWAVHYSFPVWVTGLAEACTGLGGNHLLFLWGFVSSLEPFSLFQTGSSFTVLIHFSRVCIFCSWLDSVWPPAFYHTRISLSPSPSYS